MMIIKFRLSRNTIFTSTHCNSNTNVSIFIKLLHCVEALVWLLTHAFKRRYCRPFWNVRAKSEGIYFDVCKEPPKLIGYHSNVPWTNTKLTSV